VSFSKTYIWGGYRLEVTPLSTANQKVAHAQNSKHTLSVLRTYSEPLYDI